MNIGNIHTMRKSVDALADTCCGRSHDGSSYLTALDSAQWLYHLHKVMRAAVHTAHLVSRRGISCLVHCSDGWDRTAQISALAELIMDPYYRTFTGFQVLIEKDWLAFGHKFMDRNGFHPKGGNHSEERSPVFIQFIDCVHQVSAPSNCPRPYPANSLHAYPQMTIQHPNYFEFNGDYLVEVCRQAHQGWFGNFLFNTMKDRVQNNLSKSAISLWTYLDSNKSQYSNANFKAAPGTIQIDSSPKVMRLWHAWFMVWHDMEFSMMWEQEGKEEVGAAGEGEAVISEIRKTRRSSAIEIGLAEEQAEQDEVPSDGEDEGGEGGIGGEAEESDDEDEAGALNLTGHASLRVNRRDSAAFMASESRKAALSGENYAVDE